MRFHTANCGRFTVKSFKSCSSVLLFILTAFGAIEFDMRTLPYTECWCTRRCGSPLFKQTRKTHRKTLSKPPLFYCNICIGPDLWPAMNRSPNDGTRSTLRGGCTWQTLPPRWSRTLSQCVAYNTTQCTTQCTTQYTTLRPWLRAWIQWCSGNFSRTPVRVDKSCSCHVWLFYDGELTPIQPTLKDTD